MRFHLKRAKEAFATEKRGTQLGRNNKRVPWEPDIINYAVIK
jgi:hypothetical protein